MGAQQVVPAVIVDHHGSLAVDGDVHGLVAGETGARLGIELDHPDVAEIGAVGAEQTAVRVHQEADVDGVAVLVHLGVRHFDGLGIGEIRGVRVQGLVPHREDTAGVTAAETAARGAVAHEVPVTDLDGVRGRAAAGTDGAALPHPAVFGDQAATTGADGSWM